MKALRAATAVDQATTPSQQTSRGGLTGDLHAGLGNAPISRRVKASVLARAHGPDFRFGSANRRRSSWAGFPIGDGELTMLAFWP